ncbi:hypothetical protein MKW98_026291 [Papaver atlanticum]|uniref:PUM-HD domain-containing protein n=1 Tax=Papaver atlanticum TaxID=357466 RepID=A0AAD4X6K4_9MAGN|nr:hypothetical protein MKW98_026291 [Papaver atlanticum]
MADGRNHNYHHQPNSALPPAYTIPVEEELLSFFQGLSTEEERQYELFGASNSMLRSLNPLSPGYNNGIITSNHMNGWGSPLEASSSRNYPSLFEHSTSTIPIMGQGSVEENPYVNSHHHQHFQNLDVSEPFLSLRMQGWTDDMIWKFVMDDPSLLGEVNADDITMMFGHKLGETPRRSRFVGGLVDSFRAVVCIIANEANTRSGSCAMRNLIKLLKGSPMLIDYVLEVLKPNLLPVMLNQNGSQVVQCILRFCTYGKNMLLENIYETAAEYCLELATTEQGVFSLKAVIESIEDPLRTHLLSIILGQANFVVQHVLERHPYTANLICNELLRGNLFKLSKDKYGSRVVEKCIESNATDVVVSHLLSNRKQLVKLAQDKVGNYVVQKALKETKALCKLVDILLKGLRELDNHPNGRNVYNLIMKKILLNQTRNRCIDRNDFSGSENCCYR